MRLRRISISNFRSIKEPLTLHLDPKVTILIGANDAGKTNLLRAIRILNDDAPLDFDDENWDMSQRAEIEYEFTLDISEQNEIKQLMTVPTPGDGETMSDSEPESTTITVTDPPLIDSVVFSRTSEDGTLRLQLPTGMTTEVESCLLKFRPRVELFLSVEQLMDVITLAELEEATQEFMQGIFRYAGIWEDRARLFQQNPATAKRLQQASVQFTNRIRAEWRQGENLTFEFKHAGRQGDHIELLISDPSVANRFVRPSERSEGFSTFFKLTMRQLARTEASRARAYLFLFDEPGTALHPAGQVNLQRVFERLSARNQLVYATHSLFMINHNRPERSRVISKDERGTRVDQKPYLRNWRAVRQALGLILAGNFFIADTTLLVEGESDALYVGALLAAVSRADLLDVDLNLFSVQWAGNSRDVEPMARLMLEEGRHVVALVDGDSGGDDIKRRLDRLNIAVQEQRIVSRSSVVVIQLDRNQSTEDILLLPKHYVEAVLTTSQELIDGQFRHPASPLADQAQRREGLRKPENSTLGRHVENITKGWFTPEEPIAKLAVARAYCASIETENLRQQGVDACPAILKRLTDALNLKARATEESVTEGVR